AGPPPITSASHRSAINPPVNAQGPKTQLPKNAQGPISNNQIMMRSEGSVRHHLLLRVVGHSGLDAGHSLVIGHLRIGHSEVVSMSTENDRASAARPWPPQGPPAGPGRQPPPG